MPGASARPEVWRNAADGGPSGAVRAWLSAPSPPGRRPRRPVLPRLAVSDGEPHQLPARQGQHAEEQVAGHPGVPPDADVPGAVRVLQGGVHAPAAGALPVADAVVADVARFPLRQRLFPEALLQRRVAAGVGVGDRHAPRQAGVEPDLQGIT